LYTELEHPARQNLLRLQPLRPVPRIDAENRARVEYVEDIEVPLRVRRLYAVECPAVK
jgi:hypothetical protein